MSRADRREAYVGENELDADQRAKLMALTPRELPTQVCLLQSDTPAAVHSVSKISYTLGLPDILPIIPGSAFIKVTDRPAMEVPVHTVRILHREIRCWLMIFHVV